MAKSINITQAVLRKSLESIKGSSILVVGDIMLDRYIWGNVERISPEAPVPVVQVKKMEDRLGGAGNVVRNLCAIGVKVSLAGFLGKDEEGSSVIKLLKEDKVNYKGVIVENALSTTVKTRVIAQHQQIVRVDREEIPNEDQPSAIKLREKLSSWLERVIPNYSAVIVSDYGKGVISGMLLATIENLRKNKKSKLGNIPVVVDPHPAHYSIYKGMSVAKPNRKEAELASGIKINNRASASKAAHYLLQRWQAEMMLISLGEDGLIIAQSSGANDIFLETVAKKVSDVSGAGDTVTAVFSAALACGAAPVVAGTLANIAAGIVVSEVGTVPVNLSKLKEEIDNFN